MKYLLLFILSIVSNAISAQVEVIEPSPKVVIGEVGKSPYISSQLYKIDSIYCIMFRDGQYQQITSFESFCFTGSPDDLYNQLKALSEKPNGEEISLLVGITRINVYKSSSGLTIFKGRSHFSLTKKNLDKLFGK